MNVTEPTVSKHRNKTYNNQDKFCIGNTFMLNVTQPTVSKHRNKTYNNQDKFCIGNTFMLNGVNKNLDMSVWIDLVNGFAGRPASLAVKIITLDKNTVITETPDPYVTFSIQT